MKSWAEELAERLAAFRYALDEEVEGLFEGATDTEGEAGPEAEPDEAILAFTLESGLYGVRLSAVLEILKARPLTEVPRAEPSLIGLLALRGEVTPVYDPKPLLGLRTQAIRVSGPPEGRAPTPPAARILVVRTERGPAGLWVDHVREVMRIPPADIEPPPAENAARQPGLRGDAACPAGLVGIARYKGARLSLLNVDGVLG